MRNSTLSFERERGITGIEVIRDVAHVFVPTGDEHHRVGRTQRVFHALGDAGVPIFLTKLHRSAVTFAVPAASLAQAEATLRVAGFETRSRPHLAVVTVRAVQVRDILGVMVQITDALMTAGAQLYATGDSHDTVQCLIEADVADQAAQELAATFQLDSASITETPLSRAR